MKKIVPPLLLIGAILLFWLLEYILILPSANELIEAVTTAITNQGVLAIAAVALLENIIVINSYFPGSVAILGVMASTHGNVGAAILTFSAITVGQLIGLTISFYLGRFGFHNKSQSVLENNKRVMMVFLFWHPHLAAASSFAIGARSSSNIFFIWIACILWSVFWALVMYFGFGIIVKEIGWDYITIIFAFAWLSLEIYRSNDR